VDKNKRKNRSNRRKGGKAFGGDSDSEDEDDVRRRKAAEKAAKELEERGGISKEMEILLNEQAVVRARVNAVVSRMFHLLDAISVIVRANKEQVSVFNAQ
jgi:hypothetical protein